MLLALLLRISDSARAPAVAAPTGRIDPAAADDSIPAVVPR